MCQGPSTPNELKCKVFSFGLNGFKLTPGGMSERQAERWNQVGVDWLEMEKGRSLSYQQKRWQFKLCDHMRSSREDVKGEERGPEDRTLQDFRGQCRGKKEEDPLKE